MNTMTYKGFDIPVNLLLMTGGGPETFSSISEAHIHNLEKHVGLSSGMTVLEIGCGIGRDAIPLIDVLGESGSYFGVDIIKPSIDWCVENIQSKHSNFKFIHVDIRDQLHNPSGSILTTDFSIPIESQSVDRIIVQSVFTHMFPKDISHYLSEFARVLKTDGRCYATVFIYDDDTLKSSREKNLTPFNLRFEYELVKDIRLNDPAHPTGAVAYTKEFLVELVSHTGLELIGEPLKGGWSGFYENPDDGQDVLILGLKSSL